ncbi:hypothetical protein ALDI51_38920 [Alicycliphilus denitrificans]|nr:hypothetical protein ALDI51_38920 [Alicycliphilus denitrificans]
MRGIIFVCFIVCSGICQAKGWIDANSTYNRYVGWACVPNSGQIVGIHIYAGGTYIGGGNASLTREFAVQQACNSTHSNHGFDIPVSVPAALLDGTVRDVQIYSIHEDGSVAQLDNSPVRLKFEALPGRERPSNLGDIVGRDLQYEWGGPLNYFGHIGIWDGGNVIEATGASNSDDTLKITSWATFSSAPALWPTVVPVLSDYAQNYCREIICNVNGLSAVSPWILPIQTHVGGLRELAAKRAYLSYLIGASYTRLATFTPTKQGTKRYQVELCSPFASQCNPPLVTVKASRGTYRCETFVMHSWAATSIHSEYAFHHQSLYGFENPKKAEKWGRQIDYIMSPLRIISPKAMYENFKKWNV